MFSGYLALGLVPAVVAAALLRAFKRRQDDQPVEKREKRPVLLAILVIGIILSPGFGYVLIHDSLRNARYLEIRAHGYRTEADVASIYIYGCPRRGACRLGVKYRYLAPTGAGGGSKLYTGDDILSTDQANDPRLIYATRVRHVPIAYDVEDPRVSAVNFSDDVFKFNYNARSSQRIRILSMDLLVLFAFLALGALIFSIMGKWKSA